MEIKGKQISILGAERSGVGAARLVKRLGGIPFVSDHAKEDKISESLKQLAEEGIEYECGAHSNRVFDTEFIIVSPGVPSNSSVMVQAYNRGITVISEIEFAFYYCKGKVIATTGTNGKTTVTSLIAYLINGTGRKCYTAGNIGYAFSEIADLVKEDEYVSLEVSSFQLDHCFSFKPAAALILNITPDHLNRYENCFENYISSKRRIYRALDEKDYLILNGDDANLSPDKVNTRAIVKYFSLTKNSEAYFEDGFIKVGVNGGEYNAFNAGDLQIRGEHNYANTMAALLAVTSVGVPFNEAASHLSTFAPVEHRLELVAEIDGVKYINDSKATNVDSVWYALRSFEEPLYLILGGQDKGNDYGQIRGLVLEKVKKIFAIGSSAEKIFNYFHHDVKVEIKNSMEECVKAANLEAKSGDVVLLSPACASFDMFDNYEHRGRVFKTAVEDLFA
ncbi:MAG: UDP-N-acetylmuramoyl-L-alanine--D-glutamate ligase [Ignavibacteriaceae bacterium]|nr:UDP-N-acetylmuramoyl-L-alanine--D-glutamate ligase [Ignavibacteriaceae bacterium]